MRRDGKPVQFSLVWAGLVHTSGGALCGATQGRASKKEQAGLSRHPHTCPKHAPHTPISPVLPYIPIQAGKQGELSCRSVPSTPPKPPKLNTSRYGILTALAPHRSRATPLVPGPRTQGHAPQDRPHAQHGAGYAALRAEGREGPNHHGVVDPDDAVPGRTTPNICATGCGQPYRQRRRRRCWRRPPRQKGGGGGGPWGRGHCELAPAEAPEPLLWVQPRPTHGLEQHV